MTEQEFYAQIPEPYDVRRHLLSASKQVIQLLQRYEHLKQLRVQKLEQISQLRKLNKEINLLITKIKKGFPETKLNLKPGQVKHELLKTKKSRTHHAAQESDEDSIPEPDEVMKLESQLREIEDKLNNIT